MTVSLGRPVAVVPGRLRVTARATVMALATAFLLSIGWLQFGPVALGGHASYVITDGISMLPNFKADGLVITRVESEYHVGEVVAYHNRQLGAVVMHRIVARDGRRYVFQGDNNDFRDSYHPTEAQLVGKEWLYVPGAGRYLLMLRKPWLFAGVVALIALVSFRQPARNRRRRGRSHAR